MNITESVSTSQSWIGNNRALRDYCLGKFIVRREALNRIAVIDVYPEPTADVLEKSGRKQEAQNVRDQRMPADAPTDVPKAIPVTAPAV